MQKLGVQAYTLRNEMETDFIGGLEQVRRIGYEAIEFAGFHGVSIRDVKEACDRLGLVPVSSHVPIEKLESSLDQVLEEHQALGVRYIVCPWLPEDRRSDLDGYRWVAESLDRIGEKCAEAGLVFCYHHHDFEFVRFGQEQQTGLDVLLQNTNKRHVHLELDAYWAAYAGESPLDILRRYQGRCPLVHLKDMDDQVNKRMVEVGEGILPFQDIVAYAKQTGVQWFFVELDECEAPIESIRISYDHAKKWI